jgi:hypothetical protein
VSEIRRETTREQKYLVQYQPEHKAPWLLSESFISKDHATGYLERQQKRRPNERWRLILRLTVTTVTEEVLD